MENIDIMDYLTKPIEEKIIFIWIRHLRFELREHKHIHGYINIIDNIVYPLEVLFREGGKHKLMRELCVSGSYKIKSINGNQFHMNLFLELEELLK